MIEELDLGDWSVWCDECSLSEESIDAEDFYEVISQIKYLGWHIVKDINGGWNHVCPNCIDNAQ